MKQKFSEIIYCNGLEWFNGAEGFLEGYGLSSSFGKVKVKKLKYM